MTTSSITWGCLLAATRVGLLLLSGETFLICQTDPALPDLVSQAAANHLARARMAENFNYSERIQNTNFNANGKSISQASETYDVVFIENAPYRIHIAHNDRPLSSSDQKKETDKMSQAVSARKAGDRPTAHKSDNIKLSLPIAQLPTQFNLIGQGAEPVNGLPCVRVHAAPKPAFQPAKEQEVLANAIVFELWIDSQDRQIVKIEARFTSSVARFRAGTYVVQEFTKINNEVWLPKQMSFRGPVQSGRKDIMAEAEQTYSNYKKFRVE